MSTEATDMVDSGEQCTFEDTNSTETLSEDPFAGGIIAGVSLIAFIWYLFVIINVFRLMKKIPVFIIFFSQGIGDIGFLLNSLWLAIDIIIGPSSLLKETKIYSIVLNVFARPVLYHFLFIAIHRFTSVWFYNASKAFFTRKKLAIISGLIWIGVCVEIAILHIIWPSDVFVHHDISLYGFYSKDICDYLGSIYAIYLNAVNGIVGGLAALLYLCSLCAFKKNAVRKSREGRLLAYCMVDFVIVFILYALKSLLYSQIRRSHQPILLFVQVDH